MRRLMSVSLVLGFLLFGGGLSVAELVQKKEPAVWGQDFEAAQKRAKENGNTILMAFLGSDWSGWCALLNKDLFQQPEFLQEAAGKYELVLVDFPQKKSSQSAELRAANQKLKTRFGVKGYPTIVLVDAEARPFALGQYVKGDVTRGIQYLNSLNSIRARRDQIFEAAAKAKSREKTQILMSLYDVIPEKLHSYYQKEFDQIKGLDPEDKWGFRQKRELKDSWKAMQYKILTTYRKKNYDEVIKIVDAYVASQKPRGSFLQEIWMGKIFALANSNRYAEATLLCQESLKVDPESRHQVQLKAMVGEIQKMKETREAEALKKQEQKAKGEDASSTKAVPEETAPKS